MPAGERLQPGCSRVRRACWPGACRPASFHRCRAALIRPIRRGRELARASRSRRPHQSDLCPRRAWQMPDNILAAIYYVAKLPCARRQQEQSEWKRLVPGRCPARRWASSASAPSAPIWRTRRRCSHARRRCHAQRCRTSRPCPLEEIDRCRALDFVVLLLPVARDRELHRCIRAAPRRRVPGSSISRARPCRRRSRCRSGRDHCRRRPRRAPPGPLPSDHPFWRARNIVVLPHVGGVHPDRDRFVAALFVENARRFARGEPLQALVDRARGY